MTSLLLFGTCDEHFAGRQRTALNIEGDFDSNSCALRLIIAPLRFRCTENANIWDISGVADRKFVQDEARPRPPIMGIRTEESHCDMTGNVPDRLISRQKAVVHLFFSFVRTRYSKRPRWRRRTAQGRTSALTWHYQQRRATGWKQ